MIRATARQDPTPINLAEAEKEGDIYAKLDSILDGTIDLMLPSFHGFRRSMAIADKMGEEYEVDLSDSEWIKYAKKFAPNSRVIFNSCSSGRGGVTAENILTTFAKWLKDVHGLTLFAATEDIRNELKLENGEVVPAYTASLRPVEALKITL